MFVILQFNSEAPSPYAGNSFAALMLYGTRGPVRGLNRLVSE